MKKILLVVFILIFWLIKGFAANKYFSAVGNDANTGSLASPWRTVQKLNSIWTTLNPGDSALFRRGDTFYGGITILKSGTAGASIIISAYGTGNRPIITGLSALSGWTTTGGNIWQSAAISTLPSYLNTVVQNDNLVAVGRYPNKSAPNLGYLTINSAVGANQITINSLLNTPNFTGAWGVVRVNNPSIQYRQITSHVGTQVNFAGTFYTSLQAGFGAFFINSLNTLDSTSEWYYNPVTKRVSWYSASAPVGVEAATITNLVMSVNFSYITFDNINFRGANEASIDITGGTGIKVQNCNVNFSGISGIEMSNHNSFLIQYDSVSNTQNEGIRITGTTGGNILNSTIYKSGDIIGMAEVSGGVGRMNGIAIQGNGVTVKNNVVKRSGYGGIRWDGNNITIRENYVDTFCYVTNDGGGLYTQGATARTGNTVVKNVVLNAIGAPKGTTNTAGLAYGIYLDNDASNILVDSNTVAYANYEYFLHGGSNNIVTNNTSFAANAALHIWEQDAGQLIRNLTVKKNILATRNTAGLSIFHRSYANDIGSFYVVLDSNYYVAPLTSATGLIIRNQGSNISLPMWRTAFPAYDVHSTLSPVYVTNSSQIQFLYNATGTATVNPLTGSWIDAKGVSYATNITLQPYTSAVLINTGSLTTPVITWANPAAITYPTPLSSTQLNATANVAGSFSYSPASSTVLNAGTQTLSVLFTPTNQTLYTTASKTVTIVVNKANATMSYSNLTQTYTGLPLAPTITTSPAGLATVSTLYNNVGSTPINAGVYSIVSGLTNNNYSAPPISGTFTINKASATLTVSNLAQIYNGTQRTVTVVTSPVGLSGVVITYNGSTTAPTIAGIYAIVVSLSNTNFSASTVNTSLVISKATPSVSWATPSVITYGTALSGSQLNATASVVGTFAYTPASGTVLNAGSQSLSVNFTPTDATNYNTVNNTTVSLVVNKAVATITITPSTLNQIFDGTPKSVTVTTSPANLLVITTTYSGSTSAPSAVGTYPVVSSLSNSNYQASNATGNLVISSITGTIAITNLAQVYTGSPLPVTVVTNPVAPYTVTYNASATVPTNAASYTVIATLNDLSAADTQTLVISKAIPIVTWANPSDINFGTALSGTQLNASANVAGSFVYSPVSGTVLNVGSNQILSTTFTPTDATNYNTISTTVLINVTGNTATLSLSSITYTYDGTAKSVVVTTSPAGLSGVVILYNGSSSPPTNAATYTVNVTLSNANYTATPIAGVLTINKAVPVLSWAIPSQIPYGTALTNIQLNATSNVSGTFTYNPSSGTVLNPGTVALLATFTPADLVNYTNNVTVTVPLSVAGSPILQYFIRRGNILYIELP